jgi:phosphatidylinositol glycan class V
VLLVSILPTLTYFFHLSTNHDNSSPPTPPRHPALLPFQILHTALTLLLLFASHTQIALRVAVTDPVVWWNLADMAYKWDPAFLRPVLKNAADGSQGLQGSKVVASAPGRDVGGVREEENRIRAGRRMTKWGRLWVGYVVVWGAVSMLLWAGHYPPA